VCVCVCVCVTVCVCLCVCTCINTCIHMHTHTHTHTHSNPYADTHFLCGNDASLCMRAKRCKTSARAYDNWLYYVNQTCLKKYGLLKLSKKYSI